MNFDFSDDLDLLRDQARRFLSERCPTSAVRVVLERGTGIDEPLWSAVADMGWLGAALPEAHGGAGLGHEGLCVLAEELGRALAPLPIASSIYLAAEALVRLGTDHQCERDLRRLATGRAVGAFALAEGPGNPAARRLAARYIDGALTGSKWPVLDGLRADIGIVAAVDESGAPCLVRVDLKAAGVSRTPLGSIDPSRELARWQFERAEAELLGNAACGWNAIAALLDRAAVLVAFEQLGGASVCLETATAYAKERHAFGRPIGSFQAIKHTLADVFVANELARSNAYYGAWALATDAAELPLAAATARVAATQAYHLASKENIQTHGGMGFTWAMDCHLHYRRAKLLSALLGSPSWWQDRLVTALEHR